MTYLTSMFKIIQLFIYQLISGGNIRHFLNLKVKPTEMGPLLSHNNSIQSQTTLILRQIHQISQGLLTDCFHGFSIHLPKKKR